MEYRPRSAGGPRVYLRVCPSGTRPLEPDAGTRSYSWRDEPAGWATGRRRDGLVGCHGGGSMSGHRRVTIALTSAQVAHVVRKASSGPGFAGLLSGVSDLEKVRNIVLPLLDEDRLSRSTLNALLVLAAFPMDGGERKVTEVAKELGQSPSTTYRYISTLLAVGLLERDPRSRQYRRASTSDDAR